MSDLDKLKRWNGVPVSEEERNRRIKQLVTDLRKLPRSSDKPNDSYILGGEAMVLVFEYVDELTSEPYFDVFDLNIQRRGRISVKEKT